MNSPVDPVQHKASALTELAGKRDPEHRAVLYENVVSLFERKHAQLSETERTLMCDILRQLAHDVEMSVRAELAARLSANPNAPHDLILMLANDDIDVAKPVLLFSHLLNDSDLVEVIYHKTAQHQLAVAARENLSAEVSSALANTGDETVVTTLLENQSATISADVLAQLADRSRSDRRLQAPLVNRQDLPPSLAEKMYAWVSDALRATLAENIPIDSGRLEAALAGTLSDLNAEARARDGEQTPNGRLVDKLHGAGQLTPAFLVKSLNQGQADLFEIGFARMLDMPTAQFRKAIYSRGPDALAAACRAVGIDRSAFLGIYRLACKARNMSSNLSDGETKSLLRMFEKMDDRMAQIMVHRWGREDIEAAVA